MIIDYLDLDLLEGLGLDSLTAEKKEELSQQMVQVIDQRIFTYALQVLPEEKKQELDQLLDDESADIGAFFKQQIPHFDLVVADSIAGFKAEMVELYGNTLKTTN